MIISENKLNNIIRTSIIKVLNESSQYDFDEREYEPDEPCFKDASVYFNLNTKECYYHWANIREEDGLWISVVLTPTNHEVGDSGIGYYEYWGQTGYDTNPYVDVTDCEITEIDDYFLIENGKILDVDPSQVPTIESLSDEDKNMIMNYAIDKQIFEQC